MDMTNAVAAMAAWYLLAKRSAMRSGLAPKRAASALTPGRAIRLAPRVAGCWLVAALGLGAPVGVAAQQVVFEGDTVPAPLTAAAADAARGKAVFVQREKGHCILCHTLPDPEVRFAGNVGPPMAGVGARLSAAQMRARIVDPTRNNPETLMPAYFRTESLHRVARNYAGRTALSAQDIEDVIAYLLTLH
jgi:sulfur-oxidizing protein SoxX